MTKRLTSFLLAGFFLCSTLSAEAATYRCQALFRPSLVEVLYDLNVNNEGFLLGENLAEFTKDLPLSRQKRIRKLLNETSLGDLVSEKAVTRFAIKLSTLLFDQRGRVDNLIFKSASERAKDSAMGLIQERILRQGLLNAWDAYSPEKARQLEKLIFGLRWVSDKISYVVDGKARFVLNLPFLSQMKNREISDDLMHKILRDGYDAHEAEAMHAMKMQGRIEAYNAFKRVFNPVLLGSVLVIGTYIGMMMKIEEAENAVSSQIASLIAIDQQLANISALRDQIYESAFQGAKEDFIKKWGEAPTASEEKLLKAKVYSGINKALKARENL